MNNFFIKLIGILLSLYIVAIIIFKHNYNTITYYIDGLFLLVVLIYFFSKKVSFFSSNGLIYSYALFIVIAFFSSLYGRDFEVSSFKSLQLVLLFINMFVIYNLLKKLNLYNYFMNGILIASFINYVLLLGIIDAPFDIMGPYGHRAMGTTGNANVLAIVMIFSIFVSILYLQRRKYIYYQYINIFLALYTIIATVSKKGIIFGFSLVVLYLIILLISDKKSLIKLLFITIVLMLTIINYIDVNSLYSMIDNVVYRFSAFEQQLGGHSYGGSTYERKYLIQQAWLVFQDSPLLGHGLGTFYQLNKLGLYAHNNYMELLANVGLIGTITYYSMYYFIFKSILIMKDIQLKAVFLFFTLILLLMDVALVSYGSKYFIYGLMFLIAYAEYNNEKIIYNQ